MGFLKKTMYDMSQAQSRISRVMRGASVSKFSIKNSFQVQRIPQLSLTGVTPSMLQFFNFKLSCIRTLTIHSTMNLEFKIQNNGENKLEWRDKGSSRFLGTTRFITLKR